MRRIVLLAIATGCLAVSRDVRPEPPLVVKFLGQCRLPEGRAQVYDPNAGVFHVEFAGYGESGFEVVKVAKGTTKPVVFHLTGLPDMYGFGGLPLTLAVDGKNYLIDMKRDPGASEYDLIRDDSLFRVESRFVTEYTYERPIRMIEVTVVFTEKGRLLLKPGARVFCVMLSYW